MKKVCLLILIALLAFAVIPSVAFAETAAEKHVAYVEVDSGAHVYRASSLFSGGKSVGMRLYGFYFGNSNIPVTVEIYSDDNYDFDFYLGDRDYDDQDEESKVARLTYEQTQTKHFVLNLFSEIDAFICGLDNLVNTLITTSDVYAYNNAAQGAKISVSEDTYRILQIAQQIYNQTDGTFNPAVYRLVDLWGFSTRIYGYGNFGLPYDRPVTSKEFSENGYPLPDQKYVSAFSQPAFTDFSASAVTLSQEGEQYYVTKNVAPVTVDGQTYQQWIDLGGIAKGYAVDRIKQMLAENNFAKYFVDAGSSSMAYGKNYDGGSFSVGFQNPYSIFTNLLGVEVSDCVFSISGQYIRKYTVKGVEYSHIISGETGAPAQTGLKSVFLIIPDDAVRRIIPDDAVRRTIPEGEGMRATIGDCLTTALTVMGRNRLVDFVNGYLKDNGISIIAVYETLDGKREILSNMDMDSFIYKSDSLSDFAWALEWNGTEFRYNEKAPHIATRPDAYKIVFIVLASVFGAGVIAIIVYHFVRGKRSALQKVQTARRDKPFKPADVGAYLVVVLLIVVLFAVFFGGGESNNWQTVQVVDNENGEQLFLYNAVRNEYVINEENSNGWQIEVTTTQSGVDVRFSREIDGEQRFNVLHITRGATPAVKMSESKCGFHQDCVYTFGTVNVSGGAIVCSPNNLKVLTK